MNGDGFRAQALALPGTTEAPHFKRTAFKVRRNYATMPADAASANLLLTPEEQAHYADLCPAVRPIANKWGERGWTEVDLVATPDDLITTMLRTAWRNGGGRD